MKKDTIYSQIKWREILRCFRIEYIGWYLDRVLPKDHDFKGEQHDFIEMVYVHSGNIEIVENEKVYKMRDGDFIVHAPMEFHRLKSDAETSPHITNISIMARGELPPGIFDGVFHLESGLSDAFIDCLDRAKRFLSADSPDPYLGQQVCDGLGVFLTEISRTSPGSNVLSTENGARMYRKLVNYMQKSVCDDLSLEDLAQRNFISVSYVKKLFRTYANIGPKQFYNTLRAKQAAVFLQQGLSAAAVAERMNFSSPNYFTLFFKKQTGETPSEYRRKNIPF